MQRLAADRSCTPISLTSATLDPVSSTTETPAPSGLAAPVAGYAGASLEEVLLAKAKESLAMQVAVAAIFMAEKSGEVSPYEEDDTCRLAAQLLLELGQIEPLCRLASLRPIRYAMDIGDSARKAESFKLASGSWPPGASVALHVSTELPLQALHGLCGAKAQAVQVTGGFAPEEPTELNECALVAFLADCGAQELDVADPSMSPALVTRLLTCSGHWARVHLLLAEPTMRLLGQGQLQVDRLELDLPDGAQVLLPTPMFLQQLCAAQVDTLAVQGALDLRGFVPYPDAVQLRAIEAAPLVVADGTDAVAVVAALARCPRLDVLSDQRAHGLPPGCIGLDPQAVDALTTQRLMRRSANMAPSNPGDLTALQEAARALGALLSDGRKVLDLVRYLASTANTEIPKLAAPRLAPEVLNSTRMADKLAVLMQAGASHALLRAALAHSLRGATEPRISAVCNALIECRFPLKPRPFAAWQTVGLSFETHWMSDGMEPGSLASLTPAPRSDLDDEPEPGPEPAPSVPLANIAEHLIPAGEKTLRALKQRFSGLENGAVKKALLALLRTGHIAVEALAQEDLTRLVAQLLEVGQSTLLTPILASQPDAVLSVQTPAMADTLLALAPWPAHTVCNLSVATSLPIESIEKVKAFVQGVSAPQLVLSFQLRGQAEKPVLERLAALVTSKPGMALSLVCELQEAGDQASVVHLLEAMPHAVLESLYVTGFPAVGPDLEKAMVAWVKGANISDLSVARCAPALEEALAPARAWETLQISKSAVSKLAGQKVRCSAHYLNLTAAGGENWKGLSAIVGATLGLHTLTLFGAPLDIEQFVDLLQQHRKLGGFRGFLSMLNRKQAEAAERKLRAISSLERFAVPEMALPPTAYGRSKPVDPLILDRLQANTEHVRTRFSKPFREGTGRGFGWSLGDGASLGVRASPLSPPGSKPLVELMGDQLVDLLSSQEARVLAQTSKAIYFGSVRDWELSLDDLVRLLGPEVPMEEVAAVLGPVGDPNAGWAFEKSTGADLIRDKVLFMRDMGMPDARLAQVIGRRLRADRAAAPRLLEALAMIGAMPARQWLQEGLGVVVKPA